MKNSAQILNKIEVVFIFHEQFIFSFLLSNILTTFPSTCLTFCLKLFLQQLLKINTLRGMQRKQNNPP